ncbi:MAG: ABC transporter permease [Actinomycetota bacterium]|nr:ABC transporter permease [Actinomycetota bacterium]
MTAATHTAPLTPPPLQRLTAVELRKMTDTRAGFWLLLLVAISAIALVVLVLAVGKAPDQTMESLFSDSIQIISVLLPIVGLLLVTSEWSQRTALTTFTLVPERSRVVAAKFLAGSALAVVAVLICLAAAAGGAVIAGESLSFELSHLANGALYEVISMLGALALGLLLMHSALAIVTYFVLPTVVGIVVEVVRSLQEPSEWFDPSKTTTPLAENTMAGDDWAKLGVTVAIWVGLPLVLGLLRLRRHELK